MHQACVFLQALGQQLFTLTSHTVYASLSPASPLPQARRVRLPTADLTGLRVRPGDLAPREAAWRQQKPQQKPSALRPRCLCQEPGLRASGTGMRPCARAPLHGSSTLPASADYLPIAFYGCDGHIKSGATLSSLNSAATQLQPGGHSGPWSLSDRRAKTRPKRCQCPAGPHIFALCSAWFGAFSQVQPSYMAAPLVGTACVGSLPEQRLRFVQVGTAALEYRQHHRLNLDFFPPVRLAFFGPLAAAASALPAFESVSFKIFGLGSLGFSAVALPAMRLADSAIFSADSVKYWRCVAQRLCLQKGPFKSWLDS